MGSERERITFEKRIDYGPEGRQHAVDLADPLNATATFGYAVCGTPVRIWRDMSFDPEAADVHDTCKEISRD
jgi:hypothetical protein